MHFECESWVYSRDKDSNKACGERSICERGGG
jgi:hypothetical protein